MYGCRRARGERGRDGDVSCPRAKGRGGGPAACSASAISSGQVTGRTTRIGPWHRWQTETSTRKASEGLGGPVIIGWAPPCLAETEDWTIEIWLLTEFDGQTGTARVFMVNPTNETVPREFNSDVQLA